MITYGFAAVISTRVSNELGARNVAKAKKALTVSLALSLVLGAAFLLLLGLGQVACGELADYCNRERPACCVLLAGGGWRGRGSVVPGAISTLCSSPQTVNIPSPEVEVESARTPGSEGSG
jgi:hypothetical protein